ncbi:MAG: hypothetical protein R3C54_02170 [Parvularculaceae bacterium]
MRSARPSAALLLRIAAGDIPVPGSQAAERAMSLAFMRPIRADDFDAVHGLAQKSGGGMTNLPSDP